MNATKLATLSMSELKAFCTSHTIEPIGDKRLKATYIFSIETFQSEQTVIEVAQAVEIPDPFENQFELAIVQGTAYANESESLDFLQVESLPLLIPQQPTAPQSTVTQSPTPKPHQRQASIVVLIALLLFGTTFLVVKMDFTTSMTWVIAVGVPVFADWWRYLTPKPNVPKKPFYIAIPSLK